MTGAKVSVASYLDALPAEKRKVIAALAPQKNYFTVHVMTVYGDRKELAFVEDGFRRAGKKLDIGKACIRFKRLEDLPLGVIGDSIARVSVDSFVERYESVKRK